MEIFLKVNLKEWVYGTIDKVQQGSEWNNAWEETYKEIGGTSIESGKKPCPKNGAKTLYQLGRIKNSNMPYVSISYKEILNNYSKNGVYAIMVIDILSENPNLSINDLWTRIQKLFIQILEIEPAQSNQGGPSVAYKLWNSGLINSVSNK